MVEAAPDTIFDVVRVGTGLRVSLVVITKGYQPFPEIATKRLISDFIEDYGVSPERVLVSGEYLYAVGARKALPQI